MFLRSGQRFEATTRLLLGLTGILALLLSTVGAWWWLPVRPLASLPTEAGTCFHIYISPNSQTLVAVYDKSLAVWDLDRRQAVAVIPYDWGEEVEWPKLTPDILLAPNGQTVALARDNRLGPPPHVRLWHFATQPEPIALPDSDGLVGFTADSETLLVRHGDFNKRWDTSTAQERASPLDSPGHIRLFEGRIVVTGHVVEEGWLVNQHWNGTLSPDGRLLAALQDDGHGSCFCNLFKARTGRKLASISERMNNEPYFSPDGSRLITTFGGTHTIWDITSMPPRRVGSLDRILNFSADGRWISVEYGDWKIRKNACLNS